MSIIFFGSSDFSLPALRACLDSPWKVSAVITTPDKKRGRGLKLLPTPVKEFAQAHHLICESPDTLKDPELLNKIKELMPEYFVVSSYGKFIPSSWLAIPSKGSLNVHPSLLPKYRGAAPVNWPILNGDTETGVSIAEVTKELDAGDIFYQMKVAIEPAIDSQSLTAALSELSYDALNVVFDQIRNNKLERHPQNEALQCYARKLTKEDGLIDWNQPSNKIANQVRGLLPWPVAYTYWNENPVQVLKAYPEPQAAHNANAGEVIEISKQGFIRIQTGNGSVCLETVKPQGKKRMGALDFAHGQRIKTGDRFLNRPASK